MQFVKKKAGGPEINVNYERTSVRKKVKLVSKESYDFTDSNTTKKGVFQELKIFTFET